MADYTIASDQLGAYEITLTANEPVTVAVEPNGPSVTAQVQITVHDAARPVYARTGTDVAVQDPSAHMIPAGTWYDLTLAARDETTVAIICATTATVSVSRS